ncbi:NAD(P)H-dependent oxidoreductase subunit E [uncultured Rhodospira sp.]|uniref:complex I 24 kDa subunit family protein n=1 Tax=uncultured Rhodospira sp. TaxID=1936189 RepID=UPI002612B1DD|nr:NAD(P)H-dependent oxidoreductase subunit E [uncultured Rhodospira sp.]
MTAAKTIPDPDAADAPFAFTEANLAEARRILAKYPEGRDRSGVLPLLDLAQRQQGWISRGVVEAVAEITNTPPIRVWEVVTFYTMYNQHPIGRHHVQICTNLPCWLRGSDEIMRAAREVFGDAFGRTTDDGIATVSEVECLGACVNAPMVQIGDDYHEDLDYESAKALFQAIRHGRPVQAGSWADRQCSAPSGTRTTLTTDPTTPDGGKWIAADSPAVSAGGAD